MKSNLTQYGFQYGPALVERLASHKGYVVLGIATDKQLLQITVTPSGLIRLGMPANKQPKAKRRS